MLQDSHWLCHSEDGLKLMEYTQEGAAKSISIFLIVQGLNQQHETVSIKNPQSNSFLVNENGQLKYKK